MDLYYNGVIYPMTDHEDKFCAVLVDGNKIVKVFEEAPTIRDYPEANWIDLKGHVMFPGFTDTHIHLVGTGLAMKSVNFKDDTDIAVIKEKISTAAAELMDDAFLICEGYNDNQLGGYRLTRHELDELTHHKVIVKRICRHAAVVNSAVFDYFNIDDDVKDMEGGHYEKENGILNGWVHDNAMEEMIAGSVKIGEAEISEAMAYAIKHFHAAGLTGIHTEDLAYYNDYQDVLNSYRNVIGGDKLSMRVQILRHTDVIEDVVKDVENKRFEEDAFLKMDAMKFYADGALGGRTALFKEPYSDDPSTYGLAIYTDSEMKAQVKKARDLNANIAVHMIGDKACEMVLDAIEAHPAKQGHDRLIHVSFLNEDLIRRMKELPLICDVQPMFTASDFPWAIDRVGEERVRYSYPWKTLMTNGIICGGGSDSPIEDYRPLAGIDAAVNRKLPDDSSEGYNMEEALSVFDAIRLYTTEAAKVANRADELGMIQPGMLADFTILDSDPFKTDRHKIHLINVTRTIVDGKTVYEKE